MAYTMPYREGGARIYVFVDRVAAMVPPGRIGTLLGHVLVHEITHGLQGVSRHSARGVMKAHWDTPDFRAMEVHPLPFDDAGRPINTCRRQATQGQRALTPASE